jgi:glycosyltransferase involved in cell wall biosynthesis
MRTLDPDMRTLDSARPVFGDPGPSLARPRPKIVIATNYPPDHATFRGGVETATAALLEGLWAYRGEFEFHVLSVSKILAADVHEQRDGFAFHFLSMPRQRWLRPRLPIRVAKARRELRRLAPASVLAGYPRIFTLHGVHGHEAPKRTGAAYWSTSVDALIERYVHRHFDAFFCISDYAADVLGDRTVSFAVPNAVRSIFFGARRSPEADGPPRLVFVGGLAPLKRPADLLLAHAELRREFPDLETILCGEVEDPTYARALRRAVAERGLAGVRFAGGMAQEDLVALLARATALVLPSSQENAPMAILEAMAGGVPVVATRVGGVPSLIRDGETGLLYQAGSVAELIGQLRRLLCDADLRRRLGHAARAEAARRHHPECVAASTVAAYHALLNDQRGKQG